MIKVKNILVQYKKNIATELNVYYDFEYRGGEFNGSGIVDLEISDFSGSIVDIEDSCKRHISDRLNENGIEIRSTNMIYSGNELESVQVIFKTEVSENRFSLRGDLELEVDVYNKNSSIEKLKEYVINYIKDVI